MQPPWKGFSEDGYSIKKEYIALPNMFRRERYCITEKLRHLFRCSMTNMKGTIEARGQRNDQSDVHEKRGSVHNSVTFSSEQVKIASCIGRRKAALGWYKPQKPVYIETGF
ncbi:hypothetical protein OO006_00720 [Prosthecochloris sp. SCSIO W1101]|uniref:hypothetical protein n=1 Tax=Prosthecochloris sp. SCSIO W1101 TaxID=2992242 RepID=UPI00223D8C6F|nr:hypothetical protein [Prosthecochloris sp. SCSIO W1101]UZJ41558.1 hypothetical protein OO006_00720 [Prosthecochloris sp. SCSIO W1101]